MIIKKRKNNDVTIVFYSETVKQDFLYNHVLNIVPDENSTFDTKAFQFHKNNPSALVSDRMCTVNITKENTL